MSTIAIELQQLYYRQFGTKPVIPAAQPRAADLPFLITGSNPGALSDRGSALTAEYKGQEIWLPIKFFELDTKVFGVSELLIPYASISISSSKTIIKTPLAERRGSVREQYNIDDYKINIKGFIVGYDKSGIYPMWPEDEIMVLKKLYELNEAIKLDNALTNVFIGDDHRVVIEHIDFPTVEGGKKNYRPFTMSLESDSVFTLEL